MNWEKREGWAAQTLRGAWCSCCSNALVLTPTSANARPTRRLAARVRRSACRSPTTDQFALLFFPGYRDPVGRHAFLMEISRAATGAALAMAVSQTFFLAPSWPPGRSVAVLSQRSPGCIEHPCRSCRHTAVPCTYAAASFRPPMAGRRTNQQPQTCPRAAQHVSPPRRAATELSMRAELSDFQERPPMRPVAP